MVSKATLGNSAVLFIRDVLRNNLVDPANRGDNSKWIFQGIPTKDAIENSDYPYIILELSELSFEDFDVKGTKYFNLAIEVKIDVYANKLHDRNTISDQIFNILSNDSSSDVNNNSLASQRLRLKRLTQRSDDIYVGGKPEIIRRKIIMASFIYYGT